MRPEDPPANGRPSESSAGEPALDHAMILERLRERVDRMADSAAARFPGMDAKCIPEAYSMAAHAHRHQRRASGEPYVTHPVAVAEILAELGLDPSALAAAILHDVVEDTEVDEAGIRKKFGKEIARLVAGVTKISAIEARKEVREKAREEAESLRRLLLASVDDLRVILIKLADRLHNMQTLGALSQARRERMARETLEIYAPLANRLGIWQIKSQYEDLCLEQLHPEVFEQIRSELADRRDQHQQYLESVLQLLSERLLETGIEADIKSRTKHIYSIYSKMLRKDLPAEQIYDVLAVRVLVDELEQCYLALGVVHAMWPPVEGEFDDYISKRKSNLYQSLHTTVLGPDNRPLEVQIRTREMNELAEYGVAAHWKYKENTRHSADFQEKIAALRRIFESHDADASDAEAFVEGLKTDVFSDQVYVFTPAGQVRELPRGATPVDFAYYVHTEVGHRCRGALVDGQMVSLDTQLRTGQTVEVITAKGEAGPSRDWLNPALGYVGSNRSRAKIKQWFRRQARTDAIREGRDVLDRQLRKLGLTKMGLNQIPPMFDEKSLDDFLAAVGRHDIPAEAISAKLLEWEAEAPEPPSGPLREPPPTETAPKAKAGLAEGVTMRGADGVYTRVAGCCRPLPGERVVGYITRGKGITLHRADCKNISRLLAREPDRFMRVNWQAKARQAYPVELRLTAYDRTGLVKDITEVMSLNKIHMTSIHATAAPDGSAVVQLTVEMPSRSHLAGLMDKLENIENVIEVHRPKG